MISSQGLVNAVAHTTVEVLLNSLWQSIILTALASLVLRGMRWTNAATRYGFLCITLLALIALPVLNGLSPQRANTQQQASTSLAVDKFQSTDEPVTPAQHKSVASKSDPAGESNINSRARQDLATTTAAQSHWWSRQIQLPSGRWLLVLFAVWLLIAALRLGRVGLSFLRLHQLKRSSSPLAPEYELRLRTLADDCGIKRKATLAGLTDIGVPMVAGLLRPVILFPRKLVEGLTEDEFELILLHELGHVRRWDDWTNMVQKLAEAVFFFNPAILWVGRRLNLEREIACDDHVVHVTRESRAYAVCLTRLAELSLMPQRAGLAPGAIFGKKQIVRRVELLLKNRKPNPQFARFGLLASTAVLLVATQCLLLSPVIAVSKNAIDNTEQNLTYAATIAEESRGTTSVAPDSVKTRTPQAIGDSRARVLFPAESLKDNQGNSLTASVGQLSSSWDKAEALIGVLGKKPVLDSVPEDFFAVVKTIPSPADQTRVLSVLLSKRLSKGLLVQTMQAITSVETESDKRDLLIKAARICPNDDAVLGVYLQVVGVVRSPSDQDSALSALLERADLSRDILLRTKDLALKKIASTQSQQHVVDRVDLRLAEKDRGKA
jgi:beta-lactamase regulating signal transducer with metallopeptidase domain